MSKNRTVNRKLPPLLSISPVDGQTVSAKSSSNLRPSGSSRYHINCTQPNRLYSPGPGSYLDVVSLRSPKPRTPKTPIKILRTPRTSGKNRAKSSSALNRRKISEYLDKNESFLEEYIMNKIDIELLERWFIRKTQKVYKENINNDSIKDRPSLSRWKFWVHADKREMLQELTTTLYSSPSKPHVLTELARTVASSVNANAWTLYIYEPDGQDLHTFGREVNEKSASSVQDRQKMKTSDENLNQELSNIPIESGTTLSAYVARTKQAMRIKTKEMDIRFPDGVSVNEEVAAYVLCHPILQPDGELTGVLELYRTTENLEFHEEDEEIVNSYLAWGGIALHYAELYGNMMRQRELSSFLLTVVKSIFQDMMSMDTIIIKVMAFARKLVNADRASLFLVDGKSRELFARIFDVHGENNAEEMENCNTADIKSSSEIRFSIGKGIAGYVAMTGESLNIPNAYSDERFNSSVDQKTGYITKNLLCMPIFIRGCVIGVVQMVNKANGPFTKDDEDAFSTFAVYCGLALHHAKLYDKIRRSEQKYKVALEILAYHNTCNTNEIERIKTLKLPVKTEALKDFRFSSSVFSSDERVAASIFMITHLFRHKSSVKLEQDCLLRFTLTVRKNYRRVPYHNWAHGFTVANSVYALLTHCTEVFTPLEELSLYVACLCHDLDHRGKTNQFLANSASPLAAIYTTSTLEHHHFSMTVSILQQDGHNILKNLSSAEYKQVLGNIKHCILATDLASFFPNKAKLSEIVKEDKFDWKFVEHRLLLQSIVMTGCDLCASAKSWDQQVETVSVIFEEFYQQGDAEKAQGKQPMPMMDRNKAEEQPSTQVGFIKGICIPCYELLYSLLPQMKPLLDGCQENLAKWIHLSENSQITEETAEDSKSINEVTDDDDKNLKSTDEPEDAETKI